MFEEYKEILKNPKEVEQIFESTMSQLAAALKNEISEYLKKSGEAKGDWLNLVAQINAAKKELAHVENQIKEAKIRAEKADKYDIPREYIGKFVRDVTKNIAPEDTVWVIDRHRVEEKCPVCKGEKVVIMTAGGEARSMKCPNCKGKGIVEIDRRFIDERKVKEVHLKLCFEKDRVQTWSSDTIVIAGENYTRRAREVYTTKEEAEAALAGLEAGK